MSYNKVIAKILRKFLQNGDKIFLILGRQKMGNLHLDVISGSGDLYPAEMDWEGGNGYVI